MADAVEGARLDERFDRALVQRERIDPAAEVVEVSERTVALALGDDLRDNSLADVSDRGESEDDRPGTRGRVFGTLRREVRQRFVDVGHTHVDAEIAALGQVDGRLVLVVFHRGQQGGQVLDRIVRLQPGGLVGDESVAVGVGLVERVVGERLDLLEKRVAELLAISILDTTLDELFAFGLDQVAVFLSDGLAQVVGGLERVAGEALRDAHHRLLVEHQPVGVAEHLFHIGVEIDDRHPAVLQFGVVPVPSLCHRTGSIEGDKRR